MKAEFKSMYTGHNHQSLVLNEPISGDGLHICVDHGSDGVRGIVISVEDAVRMAGKALRISRTGVILDSYIEDITSILESIAEELDLEEKEQEVADFALELYNVYRINCGLEKTHWWPNEGLKKHWFEVAKVAYKK